MAIDRNKIQQNAEKFVRQGKIDQAISLYEQLIEVSPRDMNLKNKVGDLLVRASNTGGAVKVFNQVADFYAEEGFYLKAIAILKKINKLDPASVGCYYKLADLYSKQGLNNDAKSQYQQVAELYAKEGDQPKAAEALSQLLKLDPENHKVRMRLAEMYTRLGQTPKALEEFRIFGDDLVKKGMLEEAVKIYEKGLAADDAHPGLVAGLVRALFDLGRMDPLIERARALYPKNRENAGMLSLLADAYTRTNQADLARQVLDKLVAIQPDSSVWKEKIAELKGGGPGSGPVRRPAPSPPAAVAPAPPAGVPDFSEMTGDYSMEELGEVSGEWGAEGEGADAVAPAAGAPEPTSGLDAEREEFIVEHTTEAEVFIKYGLVEKAIDNLEAIVNHYPDEVESLRRLRDLYLETGNKARAAEKCVDLARIARAKGEIDKALELLGEARAHDPAVKVDRASATAPAAEVASDSYSFASGEVPVELDSGPPSSGVELNFDGGSDSGVGPGKADRTETIEFSLDDSAASEEPAHIEIDLDEGQGGGAANGAGDEGIEFFDDAIRAPVREASTPGSSVPRGAESVDNSLFEQESEFLGGPHAGAGGAPAAAPAASGSLGEESLEELFDEIKKGVDAQVEEEDYETHYNLGIAYREMELVEEAIAEFQLASKDPNRFVDCCTNLGQCFREKGMHKIALKWYDKAIEALDMESPQYIGILYDLGTAYEESGDREAALEKYIEVSVLDANYRNVAERLSKLEE